MRIPNELKLTVADKLGIHDVTALARTCRGTNELLGRIVYLRAKDSRTIRGRPYFLQAVDDGNLAAVERFVAAGASVNMTDIVTDLPETAMLSCAHFGHVEIAVFLVTKGIDVSTVSIEGHGVLDDVAMGARPEEALATLGHDATTSDTIECPSSTSVYFRIGSVCRFIGNTSDERTARTVGDWISRTKS